MENEQAFWLENMYENLTSVSYCTLFDIKPFPLHL